MRRILPVGFCRTSVAAALALCIPAAGLSVVKAIYLAAALAVANSDNDTFPNPHTHQLTPLYNLEM